MYKFKMFDFFLILYNFFYTHIPTCIYIYQESSLKWWLFYVTSIVLIFTMQKDYVYDTQTYIQGVSKGEKERCVGVDEVSSTHIFFLQELCRFLGIKPRCQSSSNVRRNLSHHRMYFQAWSMNLTTVNLSFFATC